MAIGNWHDGKQMLKSLRLKNKSLCWLFSRSFKQYLRKMSNLPTVVHWFRLDLRLHDNLALRNAINEVSIQLHKTKFFINFVLFMTR